MRRLTLVTFLLSIFLTAPASAQEDAHAADREALLVILTGIEAALNNRDMNAALLHLDPDAVITYQDSTVTQGHDAAVEYYNRMMNGAGAIVTEHKTVANVGAPAIFHGDTAIAHGTTTETFVLARGLEFTLDANWSTTLQKRDGEWRVLSLHFSTDLFDNPLLNNARRMYWMTGAGGFAAGLLIMWLLGRSKRKTTPA